MMTHWDRLYGSQRGADVRVLRWIYENLFGSPPDGTDDGGGHLGEWLVSKAAVVCQTIGVDAGGGRAPSGGGLSSRVVKGSRASRDPPTHLA